MRYGENPHQDAALYGEFHTFFEKLHGKELSYNNIVDIQAAAELVEEFSKPTVVIIKHTNPCGVGSGTSLSDAYTKAFATDTQSAYGGIVAVNRELDLATAQTIDKVFTEVVIAPAYSEGVLEFLKKKKDRRLLLQKKPLHGGQRMTLKQVAGGILAQTPDELVLDESKLRVVTQKHPTADEHAAMMFAWKVAKHVKSNAIVYARSDRTIGIGAGQMSRVDSSRIAVLKAKDAGLDLTGTAAASDAFFPFADGLLEAVRAGATAVIQPGGSIRDAEVIKAADENNIVMLFTGIRHFRH
jgi:phosphoribosylaminoimidazolecarboxamide formyltransferase/IMP cyclohydrolase